MIGSFSTRRLTSPGRSASAKVVPAFRLAFLFLVRFVGVRFFAEVLIGKLVSYVLLGIVQVTMVTGSLAALAMTGSPSCSFWLVALGRCWSGSVERSNIERARQSRRDRLRGMGGPFAPVSALPRWLAVLAPLRPDDWAMRAFHAVLLEGAEVRCVPAPVSVLLSGAACSVVPIVRFRGAYEKRSFPQ